MSARGGAHPFGDDDLRAMLEGRAGRLADGADREVMAAVRGALAGPGGGRGTRVPSLIPAGRSIAMPAGWAVVGLAAVLVVALLGSRFGGPVQPPASAGSPVVSSAVAGSVVAGASPVASSGSATAKASLQAIVGRIEVARFRQALATGELDGQLVLIKGTLERLAIPCPAGNAAPCEQLSIPGLEGVRITWDQPTDAPFDLGRGTLAVVPWAGTLELLGRVVGDPDHPQPVYDWRGRFGALRFPYDLDALSSWLVVGGIHSCPVFGPGETPCPGPGPLLTDKEPFSDGTMTSDLQLQVVVDPPAPGIDPSRIVTPGPFLAWQGAGAICSRPAAAWQSQCASGRTILWAVVAGYDPDTVVRVDLP